MFHTIFLEYKNMTHQLSVNYEHQQIKKHKKLHKIVIGKSILNVIDSFINKYFNLISNKNKNNLIEF